MLNQIRAGLVVSHTPNLVDELLQAYQEAKRNYYLGGLRLSAVEGGRFCEAAFRLLQERTTGSFTPLNKQLDSETLIHKLSNIPSGQQLDSIRLHIPRALRMVYDIRNKRDAAHLADNIDPNLQDAVLVISNLDWVLAEFVRIYHSVPPNEAQRIVEGLVTRCSPAIQEFGKFLKVLNPRLKASDHVLLLLYQRGTSGAIFSELNDWVRPSMRGNLRRTLSTLIHARSHVHLDEDRYQITFSGIQEVERLKLYELPS